VKLILIKFIYNNLYYLITNISLFFALYNFYFIIKLYIKDNILKREALIIKERVEKIKEERVKLKK